MEFRFIDFNEDDLMSGICIKKVTGQGISLTHYDKIGRNSLTYLCPD